jgi:hypothetical protein
MRSRKLARDRSRGDPRWIRRRGVFAFGVTLQARAEFTERETFFYRKISGMRHRGVTYRDNVAVAKEEAVAFCPIGILGIVREDVEIQRRENIGHAKGAGRVA